MFAEAFQRFKDCRHRSLRLQIATEVILQADALYTAFPRQLNVIVLGKGRATVAALRLNRAEPVDAWRGWVIAGWADSGDA
jgi:hypothetical protein